MGIKRENLYCNGCGCTKCCVQKIREENGINMFAVVCPHCEARGYHTGYATSTRTKEQNDAMAQDKAVKMWVHVNGDGS